MFVLMKTGLLYIVFAFFVLMLVSLKDTDGKQNVQDVPDCQITDISIISGEVPAISFSLKKVLPEVTYAQSVNERFVESVYKCRLKSAQKACNSYKSEPPGANPAPGIPGLSILNPSDKDDLPHLLS